MIHYYKNFGVYLKFDEQTSTYEAIKLDGTYVSYLKNIIAEDKKNIIISGFTERKDIPCTEEEFNNIKQQVLTIINQ